MTTIVTDLSAVQILRMSARIKGHQIVALKKLKNLKGTWDEINQATICKLYVINQKTFNDGLFRLECWNLVSRIKRPCEKAIFRITPLGERVLHQILNE